MNLPSKVRSTSHWVTFVPGTKHSTQLLPSSLWIAFYSLLLFSSSLCNQYSQFQRGKQRNREGNYEKSTRLLLQSVSNMASGQEVASLEATSLPFVFLRWPRVKRSQCWFLFITGGWFRSGLNPKTQLHKFQQLFRNITKPSPRL